MTITYIGATKGDISGTAATSVTTSSASVNTSAGDLVFVFVKHEGLSTTRTITDSAGGNTWTSRGSIDHTNNDLHSEIFTSVLTNGATAHQFTCTLGAARAYFFVGAIIFRSTVGWAYFDAISAQGTSATPSAGSKTPTGAYAAVTGFGEYAAVTWTAGTGWTSTLTGTSAVSFMERRTNTISETITGNATSSSSMNWTANMAVFLEATTTVSGTLNTTNFNDTVVASGTTTVTGTLARTNSNDTSAAAGTTTIVGSLSQTNSNDSVSASGSVGSAVSGTLAVTNQNDTLASQGSTTVTGLFSYTNINDSIVASGTTTITGTVAKTNNNDTLNATGFPGNPVVGQGTRLPLTGAGAS